MRALCSSGGELLFVLFDRKSVGVRGRLEEPAERRDPETLRHFRDPALY